ncbi:piwi-like protein 2 [Oscarella lobularis]|uniref:piwi-like protein 2 n=1 Tax=Oscarella lobularis TaxID=121494 RepID=UPI003313D95A
MTETGRSRRGAMLLKGLKKLEALRSEEKSTTRKAKNPKQRALNDVETKLAKEIRLGDGIEHVQTRKTPLSNDLVKEEVQLGDSGEKALFQTNYVRLTNSLGGAFQYAVSFRPHVESSAVRIAMLREHEGAIGTANIFDGTSLYLPIQLPQTITNVTSTQQTDGAVVTISITFVKFVKDDECVFVYNLLLKRVMRCLKMHMIGRHYFDSSAPLLSPQHKLEIWPGVVTNIQKYEGGLLLLCDATHKYLRTDTVYQVMYDIYDRSPQTFEEEARGVLIGHTVLTRYNDRTYRIDDIDWNKTPTSSFLTESGARITYIGHYRRTYGIEIKDNDQPLLVSRNRRRIDGTLPSGPEVFYLVPELCTMTGLIDELRNDYRGIRDIALQTRLSPEDRVQCFNKFLRNVEEIEAARNILSSWGIKLHSNLEVEGRKLPAERLSVKTLKFDVGAGANWSEELSRGGMLVPVNLQNWLLVFANNDQNRAVEFLRAMQEVCPPMGMKVKEPTMLGVNDERTDSYVRAIRDHVNGRTQCVVIIVPTSRDDRYSAIKRLCCIEKPVPSQVLLTRTIAHPLKLKSVTQKIALQVNCKLGGELWSVDIPLKNLMVVGINVYYDSSGRCVGAVVASMNQKMTRWYSRTCVRQLPAEPLMDGFQECFIAALKKYKELNGVLPGRIVVYRDGVRDEEQVRIIRLSELLLFKSAFEKIAKDYRPKFSLVVVQTRIHTRMFSLENGNVVNALPGSIIDHTVTKSRLYDFYLVSQRVTQGTVTPSYFIVIYDNSGLKPNHMQRLSYKMTHMYYNWPGTVRVPAPCQYGHKIAFLVGQSLHQNASLKLADKLFYL